MGNASMLSSHTAMKNIHKSITTPTLSVMILRLSATIIQVILDIVVMLVMVVMVDTTSAKLILVTNITVKTRRKCSVTRSPRKTPARSQSSSVRRLLILSILKLVKKIHTHCEETHARSHHSTQVVGHESHKVDPGYGGHH